MTVKFTAIAMAAAIAFAAAGHVTPAEAKASAYLVNKKAGKYKNMPKPYVSGNYLMTCASWGDCGNWNILASK